MFVINRLIGFGGSSGGAALVETLLDRTAGTNIGDFTLNGGLAAAFDGTESQDTGAAAAKGGILGYIGKTMAAPHPIAKFELYGSNNFGFSSGGSGETITWTIYGKTGAAPGSAVDGTILATSTFVDPDNGSVKTVTSGDQSTAYDHTWITLGGLANLFVAEMKIYVMV